MRGQDVIDMMMRCADEIQQQRNIIDQLKPKAECFDAICSILGLLPQKSQSYGEDIVWRLRKEARAIADAMNTVAETEEA